MKSKFLRFSTPFLALALMLTTAANSFANPVVDSILRQIQEEAKKKKPLPPTRYVASREYDTKHVALDLRFDWDKEQTYGTSTITFAPLMSNTKTVTFDAGAMQINSVKLATGAALKFAYDEPNSKLKVELDKAYQPNTDLTVVIDYRTKRAYTSEGILGGFGGGLRFIKPTAENPKKPRQIWSQGESIYNRFWFPAFDSPNDFATSEVRATVEKPFMVISNGRQIEQPKENADGTRTFHWRIAAPHANYLTSIVVGEYSEVKGSYDGIPISTFVYPNEVKEGENTAKRLPEMVRFFSEKTGVKYPYEKYAQTMVENFGGGMENISATTMIEEMIHDERTALDADQDSLQSHELAHQWFGDYVTTREWSDIWLNESFATFMEATWTEKSVGRDAYLLEMRGNQQQYLNTWKQGNRRPIVTKNYEGPDSVFDTYAYPRGGAVINNLRVVLGEENFWRAINYYLKKHAHQPVSTEQLRIAIEESTGQSMDWFFDQWLYKMGHPVFEITKRYDAAAKTLTLTVKQTQKPDETSSYPQVEFFQTPVDVEIGTAGNTRIERVQLEPKAENVFTFNADAEPLLVNFDYNGSIIKELKFEKTTDELVYQMQRDADVIGQTWALNELKTRMRDPNAANDRAKIVAAFNSVITNDDVWQIRQAAINALMIPQPEGAEALFAAISGDFPRPDFTPETIAALERATKDTTKSLVRVSAITALGQLRDAKYADIFVAALNDRSYGVIDAAAASLGATKSDKAYPALVKLLEQTSWRDRVRSAALEGLAASGDKRALDIGFKLTDKANSSRVRTAAFSILANSGKGNDRVFPLLFESFKAALNESDYNAIFGGFVSFIKLGDSRGQQAFDLAKDKFKANTQILPFVTQLEDVFKQSLKQPK